MKYYHLTLLTNGIHYRTVYGQMTSIESFLAIEKELGREVVVLYSREISALEYINAKELGL